MSDVGKFLVAKQIFVDFFHAASWLQKEADEQGWDTFRSSEVQKVHGRSSRERKKEVLDMFCSG